ncbi:MAG: hypothetical protein KW788_03610 [Candidatus Doudnabacteria bacterium]|nr:hypothetical protein [Candidatus Doudnabacteria bacterium]
MKPKKIGYRNSLLALCNEIILNASPHRGAPPPQLHTDRREERPHHTPEFLPDVVIIKARLKKAAGLPISNKECRTELNRLIGEILKEAMERAPAAPAYFELALDITEQLKLCVIRDWLTARPDFSKWHPYLVSKIERLFSTPHRS